MAEKVDVKNFMGVLRATEQTETGIRFDGRHMPSGRPVTAAGVTKAQLMTDKEMAQTWHDSIVGTYEREENERNHKARTADTPELVIRGQDGDAPDPGRSSAPVEVHHESIEAELQARAESWRSRLERLEHEKGLLVAQIAEASKNLTKAEAALDAIREL